MTINSNTSLAVCVKVLNGTPVFLKLTSGVYSWDSNPANANQFATLDGAQKVIAADPWAAAVPLVCMEEWAVGGGAIT